MAFLIPTLDLYTDTVQKRILDISSITSTMIIIFVERLVLNATRHPPCKKLTIGILPQMEHSYHQKSDQEPHGRIRSLIRRHVMWVLVFINYLVCQLLPS